MSSLALRLQARGASREAYASYFAPFFLPKSSKIGAKQVKWSISPCQGHRYFTAGKTCVALDSPEARRYTNGTCFISKCPAKYGLTRHLGRLSR